MGGWLTGGGETGERMRSVDWSDSPLGPVAAWPQSLRTTVSIMLNSQQPMLVLWGPGLVKLYNDAYVPVLGEKHPASLGRRCQDVWPELWPVIGPMLERAMTRAEPTWHENMQLVMHRRGYAEEMFMDFSYSPIRDESGGVGGVYVSCTETTHRALAERRLRTLRELATRAGEAESEDEVWDAFARVLSANPYDVPFGLVYRVGPGGGAAALHRAFGLPAGSPAAPARVAIADARLGWPLGAARRRGRSFLVPDLEARFGVVQAGPFPESPRAAVVCPVSPESDADAFAVLGVSARRAMDDAYREFFEAAAGEAARAVARLRAREHERRRAEALAEIDRAKTVFFSNVSHEFRTPLTLMLGPLETLLRDAALPPECLEQVALAHRNGRRLLKLVNTLLDFSRLEAGRVQAVFAPLDLAEHTADLASTFRSATEKAGLRLRVDCPPVGEPVYVDRDLWEKIVLNLVSNAFKFTLRGEIAVSLRRAGARVELSVRDTGVGVPAHELPRLFDRFFRAEGAKGRVHEGTGIGLALVHELVKLHGGTVRAESEVDRGSTFTVSIPLGRSHLPPERIGRDVAPPAPTSGVGAYVEEALRWLPEAPEPRAPWRDPPPAAEARERILLVDDNADMRAYVAHLLGARWDVDLATNGVEALAAVRARRPHLVVCDVMMPALDGLGLLRELRADPRTHDVPVILLSARAGDETRLEGMSAGSDDYLVKPFSARDLVARVESHLLRARIRSVEAAHARRVANVFAQTPVAIALLRGPDHVYELANARYMPLVGHRDVVGKPIREALPELRGQGVFELLDRVYSTGRTFVARSFEVELNRGSDGAPEACFFDLVYQPICDGDGAVEGIAVVAYEVTELARARREAELANRTKDEFLAILGHELRNPLAPILTALEVMRLRGVEEAERERAIIERQVKHVVGLVDDLLDVSRLTRGKIDLRKARVELADVVAQAIEMASPLFEQHRHALRVEVPRAGLAVDADPGRMAQVVSNLLANAARYTEPGGRVTVAARAEGGEVVLTVRDTGIGIDPAMLPHVFDAFVQERQASDRATGGLGIGLAIVRSLVGLHGGSVSAASAGRGLGAELTVRLPRAAADDAGAPAPAAGEVAPPSAGETPRILVVDDNTDAAALLTQLLTLAGYAVRYAHDGPSAIELARSFAPDVAVLDIGLPVMDGYELARRLRDAPETTATRLVALSGYGQEQDRALSSAAGFAAHLVKPVDLERLRAVVEAQLGRAGVHA